MLHSGLFRICLLVKPFTQLFKKVYIVCVSMYDGWYLWVFCTYFWSRSFWSHFYEAIAMCTLLSNARVFIIIYMYIVYSWKSLSLLRNFGNVFLLSVWYVFVVMYILCCTKGMCLWSTWNVCIMCVWTCVCSNVHFVHKACTKLLKCEYYVCLDLCLF